MGPPLMPVQAGFSLSAARPSICIELFLDLICPFSSKMFKTVYNEVLPTLPTDTPINFVLNQVPQPWHPQGTMVHEAALAVKEVAPESYPAYCHAIFKAYDDGAFKDDVTWDKTRRQIYDDCLALLGTDDALKKVDASAVSDLLAMNSGGGNAGNAMTQRERCHVSISGPPCLASASHRPCPLFVLLLHSNVAAPPYAYADIKWAVKYHRCRGVHVTPTVHVNGLEAGIVSSGWSGEQWRAFIEPMGSDKWQGSKLS